MVPSGTGCRAGSPGDMAAFSFYPSKNLGAMGDAGAFVTHDDELAERRADAPRARPSFRVPLQFPGYTARLDTVQALVLLCKLRHVAGWNAQRARAADFYSTELAGIGDLQLPPVPKGQLARLAPLRGPHAGSSSTRARTCASVASRREALPRASAPLARLRPPRVSRRSIPRCGSRGARGTLPPTLPGHFRGATRPRLRGDQGLLRAWLAGRRTTLHTDSSSTSRSATTSRFTLHESLRLSDRRQHAHRTFRRDSARSGGRRELQDPEPLFRLRGRRARRRGLRRARRDVHQRQISPRDERSRANFRPTPTGPCCGRPSSAAPRSGRAPSSSVGSGSANAPWSAQGRS